MNHWGKGLNPEQVQAVLHVKGPLLILAGAGSGKTTVLVARTGHLIEKEKIKASEICVLTFTNKAAKELKHRVEQKLGGLALGLWAGTFHSFGLKILREFHKEVGLPRNFGVIDSSDAQSIVKELLKNLHNSQKSTYDIDVLVSMLSDWRAKGITRANKDDEYDLACEWLLPKYIKKLELLGVVDFDSLLLKPLELMKKHPEIKSRIQNRYSQVMVDEFQDTNKMQMQLIHELVEKHQNITVVGDDDQSIYGWRGAEVQNILKFPHLYDHCKVIKLERNYRSTPAILELANEVIVKNKERHGKVLRPKTDVEKGLHPELLIFDNEDIEAEQVVFDMITFHKTGRPWSDFAILYRSNSQGALIEASLRRQRIPYVISGGTAFFDRKEIKDILAYLRSSLAINEVGFRRILNTPPRGIGDTTVEQIMEYSEKNKISFLQAAKSWAKAGVNERSGKNIDQLFALLSEFTQKILHSSNERSQTKTQIKTPGQNLLSLLIEIGYKKMVEDSSKDKLAAAKKWGLVEVFCNVLDSFVEQGGRSEKTLHEFLDSMELRDQPEEKEAEPKVQLMTLHACKGLEYPICYLIGVEEDILPHKTLGSDISEERRLFYVGITRAKERLILTRARSRKRYGRLAASAPSRFLLEITAGFLKVYESGFRPVTENERQNLLGDFYKKLNLHITK